MTDCHNCQATVATLYQYDNLLCINCVPAKDFFNTKTNPLISKAVDARTGKRYRKMTAKNGRPKNSSPALIKAQALLADGVPRVEILNNHGVSRRTLQRAAGVPKTC